MAEIIERKNEIIYSRISEISVEEKTECSLAFNEIVNRIKETHLS